MTNQSNNNNDFYHQIIEFERFNQLTIHALESLNHGVIILNRQKKVVLWNKWIERYSNIDRKKALGKEINEVFPNLQTTRVCQAIQESLTHGWSAIISSRINASPFPLYTQIPQKISLAKNIQKRIEQFVIIKPIIWNIETNQSLQYKNEKNDLEEIFCLIEISDVTSAHQRETILRQQSIELKKLHDISQQNENFLRAILQSAVDGIITTDSHGVIHLVNSAVQRIFDYKSEELIGKNIKMLMADEDKINDKSHYVFDYFAQHIRDDDGLIGLIREVKAKRRNGSLFPMDISISPIEANEKTTDNMFLAIVRDVSRRKKDEEIMRLMQFSLEHISDAAFWINLNGEFLRVNNSACQLLGYSRTELLSLNITDIDLECRSIDTWESYWEELRDKNAFTFETFFKHKDLYNIPVEVSANYLEFDGTEYNFVFVRNISDKKQAESTIRHLAFYDSLTDLPNRRLFKDRLEQLINTRNSSTLSPFAIMYLDLDRFKAINDNLGQSGGDLLIKQVADRIHRQCIHESDTFARLGGDEFGVIVTSITQIEGAGRICEKIQKTFAEPFILNNHQIYITASIGLTIYPSDAIELESLLQNADIALYRAKQSGRNNYQFYTSEMGKMTSDRLNLERELRNAIDRNELFLMYQPQIDIQTGRIKGVEALIRWSHPILGVVSPAKFIPLTEETGLIIPIGEWVLRTACKQNKEWQDKGLPPIRMSVNISALQFQQKNLLHIIEDALFESQLDPHFLELELTESIIMVNAEQTIKTLKTIEDKGIQLAIDDFGTGYSSLNYLKRFPIHRIKIDRSFIMDIMYDSDDVAITQAIIALSQSLRLNVIAEGVESQEQYECLRQMGCNEIQGYVFSKPIMPRELEKLLVEQIELHKK